jgi:hypothetical protein
LAVVPNQPVLRGFEDAAREKAGGGTLSMSTDGGT